MHTVSNTRNRLIIEDRPHLLAGFIWLMGLAAILAAVMGQTAGLAETLLVYGLGIGVLALAWRFFPFQRYTFDRAAGEFSRRIARVTGATVETIPLAQVKGAVLMYGDSDGAQTHSVALMTSDGLFPLEFGFVSSAREPVVAEINDWLQGRNT